MIYIVRKKAKQEWTCYTVLGGLAGLLMLTGLQSAGGKLNDSLSIKVIELYEFAVSTVPGKVTKYMN